MEYTPDFRVFIDSCPLSVHNRSPMFGIYVHIPFCVHRCSYCDFYSTTRYGRESFEKLAEKLEWETRASADWLEANRARKTVTSIFFGGGTPSLMPIPLLARVFAALRDNFVIADGAEVTLEANPETVNDVFVEGLARHTPVNRVSLGAQSFQPEHLKTLERRGSPESIRTAVSRLRAGGFSHYSLDLISGIPGQTAEELCAGIDFAAELGPEHLSFYNLTLKPGHPLFTRLPSDDQAADLYEQGRACLEHHGFEAYEISNFCREGRVSRHNLLYWSGDDFLGLGPSAATRFFWDGKFYHRKQVSNWENYIAVDHFPSPGFEATSDFQTVLEASFLELRKRDGIHLDTFRSRYGYDLTRTQHFGAFRRAGMLEVTDGFTRLTRKGWLLAEGIAEKLVQFPV